MYFHDFKIHNFLENVPNTVQTTERYWYMYVDFDALNIQGIYVVHFKPGTTLAQFDSFKANYDAKIFDEGNFPVDGSYTLYQAVIELDGISDLSVINDNEHVSKVERSNFDARMISEVIDFEKVMDQTPEDSLHRRASRMGHKKYKPQNDGVDEDASEDIVNAEDTVDVGKLFVTTVHAYF
eukprot:Awhi_evm1s7098